jgi:hypothetical protein
MTVGTGAISLSEVTNEIIGVQNSLQDCVDDACAAGFNGTYYTAPATSLAEFRGYNDAPCNIDLTISPTSTIRTASAGSFTITVTVTGGSTSWSASDNQTWITLSPATPSGTTSGSFTVNYTSNLGASTRFGTVSVTWSGTTRTCTVAQQPL